MEQKTPPIAGTKKKKVKIRLARKQIQKKQERTIVREEGGLEYNIWYHRRVGQFRTKDESDAAIPAKYRCNIVRDAGWTKGCGKKDAFFCLFFARGCCSEGHKCGYLHRIPTARDEVKLPLSHDCFGRERFATDRNDMGGVGSFNRESKTLYIGNLKNIPGVSMQATLKRHFQEWGKLVYIRDFAEQCKAFIRYELRASAEFAKEAMWRQALDDDEIIDIKWAADDDDEMARAVSIHEKRNQMIEALEKKNKIDENRALAFSTPDSYKAIQQPKDETKNETKDETKDETINMEQYMNKNKTENTKQQIQGNGEGGETKRKQNMGTPKDTATIDSQDAKTYMEMFADYYKTNNPSLYASLEAQVREQIQTEENKFANQQEKRRQESRDSQQRSIQNDRKRLVRHQRTGRTHVAPRAGTHSIEEQENDLSYEKYLHTTLKKAATARLSQKRPRPTSTSSTSITDEYPDTLSQYQPPKKHCS